MKRTGFVLLAALISAAGCEGLKDAMTAHVDVAARAGSQELSVQTLGELLGSTSVPLQANSAESAPIVQMVANVWADYQLLGQAAAANDSLTDPKAIDEAMELFTDGRRLQKFYAVLSSSWGDTTYSEAEYNQGQLLSAAHILLKFPEGATPAQMDSVKRVAEGVRRHVTMANFDDMVTKHSGDPGSVRNRGLYPAFARGMMVKEFEDAVIALKPGEISGLVQTTHGYHIIRRPLFDEVRSQHGNAKAAMQRDSAQKEFMKEVEESGKIEIKGGAGKTVKEALQDIEKNKDDKSVIATSRAGKLTVSELLEQVRATQNPAQMAQQLQQLPDSMLEEQVKMLAVNNLLLMRADSAKVELDSAEVIEARGFVTRFITDAWRQLGVDPATLGDSSADRSQRLKVAASRVDDYFRGMLSPTAGPSRGFIAVPLPVQELLREKYPVKINSAGLERAIEVAMKVRAQADSNRVLQPQQPPQPPQVDTGNGAPPAQQKQPAGSGRGGSPGGN